jgi:phosphatidylserine/phosphatidylglycerophosphate/cardiolipin synthase-like enzyme
MYDPEIHDNYYEWIELYNPTNESINLSGWKIADNYVEDSLEGNYDHGNGTMIIPPYGYGFITDHGTKFYNNFSIPNETIKLYVDDAAIGNGLGNSGDKIVLKDNQSKIVDEIEWIINYSEIQGSPASSVAEGNSLSRYKHTDTNDSSEDFYEGIIPTPGYENIFIEEGETKITCEKTEYLIRKNEILEISLNIKNCGDFFDNIAVKIKNITYGWRAIIEDGNASLDSNESTNVSILVSPCQINGCKTGEIIIVAESEKEYNISDEITLFFEIFAPDLTIREIKVYNEEKILSNILYEGEIVRIKAFLKNYGKENATNAKAGFYIDKISKENFLGLKHYDSVGKYQKYPSIKWDTHGVNPGKHKIFVIADENDIIDETDENNNVLSLNIEILDTKPSIIGRSILITDVYYHSRPGLYNEFISIYNPTSFDFNISGWYLTNEPFEIKTEQIKIIFPNNTILPAKSKLILAENASGHKWETDKYPDFEYNYNSNEKIPQMVSSKKFIMSNKGDAIAIKDHYNHTIDFIVYGNASYYTHFWKGESIAFSSEGVILKRNFNEDDFPVDTNTSLDWINTRRYQIGQSAFSNVKIQVRGEIQTFVSPDCSYETIVDEIRNASKSIHLNIYEFTHPLLCNELIKALLRNVSVNIFLEGSPIGGISDEEKYVIKRINNYGGNIRFLVSNTDEKIYSRYRFDHAKYIVIDNQTVIVKSCNWGKTGVHKDPSYGNREWGVIIRNQSVVQYFLKVFLDDWNPKRCDSYPLDRMNLTISSGFYMDDYVFKGSYSPEFESETFVGNFSVVPVFSPDTSYEAICDMIDSANDCIYIEQLYIYKNWNDRINPFVERLVNKSNHSIDVKIILNYNPNYEDTNDKCNKTKQYFEENGIEVRFVYTNWSFFTNVHNKGMIVDNKSVLISSVNWNENSVMRNREAGIIIENEEVAQYYADVFFYDWNLSQSKMESKVGEPVLPETDYKNTIYIVVIFTMTFALIARDWRKRQWT